MSNLQPIKGAQNVNSVQPECIRVIKVYDWVVDTNVKTKKVYIDHHIQSKVLTCDCIDISCKVVDTDCVVDEEIKYNVEITVPGGGTAIVSIVNITWIAKVEITLKNTTTGVTCCFIKTFYFNEDYYLCVPEELTRENIFCKVTAAHCQVKPKKVLGDMVQLTVTICKDIQVEAEVKLEVEAKFCQPRDVIPIQDKGPFVCPPNDFPEQCPILFPRENCCGTSIFNVSDTITATNPANSGIFSLVGEICRNCAHNQTNTSVFASWQDNAKFDFTSTNVIPPTNYAGVLSDFGRAVNRPGSFCFKLTARQEDSEYGIKIQGEGVRIFTNGSRQSVLFELIVYEPTVGPSSTYQLKLYANSISPANLLFDTGKQTTTDRLEVKECIKFT